VPRTRTEAGLEVRPGRVGGELRELWGMASEPPVCQLLPQPLRQLQPVAEVPAISARAANDGLSVCFRMAARGAAKLLPEPQRGGVLARVEGCPVHFFNKVLALDGCSN